MAGLPTVSTASAILGSTAANITATQNAAITITNATGAFTTGNGTLTVFLYYSVL